MDRVNIAALVLRLAVGGNPRGRQLVKNVI